MMKNFMKENNNKIIMTIFTKDKIITIQDIMINDLSNSIK